MNTGLVNTAAGVINAALEQNRTAAGIALALESAQLLMTPEVAAELERLRTRVAELEATRPDMTPGACTHHAMWRHVGGDATRWSCGRCGWETGTRDGGSDRPDHPMWPLDVVPESTHPAPCRFPKAPGCTCRLTGAEADV